MKLLILDINKMEQKPNGRLLRRITQNFKFLLFLLLIHQNCISQNLIGRRFDLSSISHIVHRESGIDVIQSKEMKSFLKTKTSFFIDKGGSYLSDQKISIFEIACVYNSKDMIWNKERDRFLFFEKNEILIDTLKIAKGLVYSICQLDKEDKTKGIAVGKYKIISKNFEISALYTIEKNGKLKKSKKNTIIFDCPAPIDYEGEEENILYEFGIIGGKKYKRYWYEQN